MPERWTFRYIVAGFKFESAALKRLVDAVEEQTQKQARKVSAVKKKDWDVMLCYRENTDRVLAEKFYYLLKAQGIKVWWDAKCLTGQILEEGGQILEEGC